MIVRISGLGQYDLAVDGAQTLEAIDRELTEALHGGKEEEFHRLLRRAIEFVQQHGSPVPHDQVVPSQVIIPPEDVTMPEAQTFFTDEGLLHPLPA